VAPPEVKGPRPHIVATYNYTDAEGHLLYQVVRKEPKGFFHRQPDGKGGWINEKSKRQVLYHLPEVLESQIVFVVEGEKNVETLRDRGFVATTNAGGAKARWLPEFTEALVGREVILIPDNDKPGRERGKGIAHDLLGHVARLVMPKLEGAKDVTEWFENGNSEIGGNVVSNTICSTADIDAWFKSSQETKDASEAPDPVKPSSPSGAGIKSIDDVPRLSQVPPSTEIAYLDDARLFPNGSITAITSESGKGKSSFVFGYLIRQFMETGHKVLYLDRENSFQIISERCKRFGIPDSDDLKYWGGWLLEPAPQPGSLMIKDWVNACTSPPLICVDSFVSFLESDENDSAGVRKWFQPVRALADLGCSVIILHHTGKATTAQEYRGSSDFPAAVDVGFKLTNSSETGELGILKLKHWKNRFGAFTERTFYYRDGLFNSQPDENQASIENNVAKLTDILKENEGICKSKFGEEAARFGIPRNVSRAFLDDGVKARTIDLIHEAHNKQTYHITTSDPMTP